MVGPTEPFPLFLNPRAGSAPQVREALRGDARVAVEEIPPTDLREKVHETLKRGARRIVVSGGDGSIATAASVLIEKANGGPPAELAVLPGGTFNHFAKEHGIPQDLDEAIDVAVGATTTRTDAARVNGHVFLNTSSVGAYVRFVHWRERLEKYLGYWLASFVAMIRTLIWQRPFDVELEVNGEVRRYRSTLVFIGVGERQTRLPTLGKRIEGGRPGLHVIVVHGAAHGRLVAVAIAAAARGIHAVTRTAHLDAFLVDRCTIEMPRRSGRVAVDGELVRMDAPLRYEILRDALTVVVPEGYVSDDLPNDPGAVAKW